MRPLAISESIRLLPAGVQRNYRVDDQAVIVLKYIPPAYFSGQLKKLLQETPFQAKGRAETVAHHNPQPILIEYIFVHIPTKTEHHFVIGGGVERPVGEGRLAQRHLRPRHIPKAIDEHRLVGAGAFLAQESAKPPLLKHKPVADLHPTNGVGKRGHLESAVLRKRASRRLNGVIAVRKRLDVRVARSQRQPVAHPVVDTRSEQVLLPVSDDIVAPELVFQVGAPAVGKPHGRGGGVPTNIIMIVKAGVLSLTTGQAQVQSQG